MRRDLDQLRTGNGWKDDPAFNEYFDAVETIPDLGQKEHACL